MKQAMVSMLAVIVVAGAGNAWADEDAGQSPPAACISTDPDVSDSAAWALAAVDLFASEDYAAAVETVNACFKLWGPTAGQAQKELWDSGEQCPKTGAVSRREARKIEANGLINDVALALWAKSRALHELEQIEGAKMAYGQCVFMACGRAWDPQGWYWSPADDCAEHANELLEIAPNTEE